MAQANLYTKPKAMKKITTTLLFAALATGVWAQIQPVGDDSDHISRDIDLFQAEPSEFDFLYGDDPILSVDIYPVPVQDFLTIRITCGCDLQNVRITVLDHEGLQVYGVRGDSMSEGDKRLVIPFNDLPPGNYYIWIQHEDGMITRKILKQ
jgi:hypothetical protein